MPKYKNIFSEGYIPNWKRKVFDVTMLMIQYHGQM